MWRLKLYATKSTWLLGALFLLVIIGRIWFFTVTGPQSLNQDEAAILFNARLLAETGRDEWGSQLADCFPLLWRRKVARLYLHRLAAGKIDRFFRTDGAVAFIPGGFGNFVAGFSTRS